MPTREENELLSRVGPGTPAGEMLRRYWWPIGVSTEVTTRGRPQAIRVLSEDLVLFRDGHGQIGVVGLHCSHRGASLEYGRVEDVGIRCPYHGWLYDRSGRCLEQPAEPEGSTFNDRIRHPAYRADELGGLIFAYLGPEPAPLLPRYDLLMREDGARLVGGGGPYGHFNWLQNVENAVDQAHLPFLHASGYPEFAMKRPRIEWEQTWYGVRAETWMEAVPGSKISHFVFPAHNRVTGARVGRTPAHNMFFRVPVDDTHSNGFFVNFFPGVDPAALTPEDLRPLRVRSDPHIYERVDDGWWGIISRDQDRMAVETQGEIADRTVEHLASSDRAVLLLRDMVRQAIEDVRLGRDPIGVLRDPAANEYITFDATQEKIAILA